MRNTLQMAFVAGGLAAALAAASAGGIDSGARVAKVEAPEPVTGRPARMLLSWNAPHGMPGASDQVASACNDTSRSDTLYLSLDPGRTRAGLVAMEAVLYFHPAPGDTLGPFWFFKREWPNAGNMLIEFDRAAGFPCEVAWPAKLGFGRVSYDHRSGRGRLDLAFVVEPTGPSGLAENVQYCMARVIIRQRRAELAGCLQPVCVEWASLRLKPRFGPEYEVTQGDRFVSWNAAPGAACDPIQRMPRVRSWRPAVPIGETPAAVDPKAQDPKPADPGHSHHDH